MGCDLLETMEDVKQLTTSCSAANKHNRIVQRLVYHGLIAERLIKLLCQTHKVNITKIMSLKR